MNRLLLLALIALFLPACGPHTVRDDSPASDLDALVTTVKADLKPRLLPNGKEYCAELATTEGEQDECMGDLEDVAWLSNRDKERAAQSLERGVERIKLSRDPCRWYEVRCRANARKLRNAPD
jgi:hypothetical protein